MTFRLPQGSVASVMIWVPSNVSKLQDTTTTTTTTTTITEALKHTRPHTSIHVNTLTHKHKLRQSVHVPTIKQDTNNKNYGVLVCVLGGGGV